MGAAVVAVVALSMGALAIVGGPAPARPVGISPGDGAVVDQAPRQVTLAFTDGLAPQEFHLTVATPTGAPVTTGEAALAGRSVVVPVATMDGGRYLVGYHVRLADGTEQSGVSQFSVRAGGGSLPGPAPSASAGAGWSEAAGHDDHFSKDPLSITLAIMASLMVLALLVIMFWRPAVGLPAGTSDPAGGPGSGEETTPHGDELPGTSRH
ncbi:MAG TPA: copper resistance CopC family protein [Micromonosporaceae bacterium]